jgi:single-strand selective monofunctional uracil DNA glycosylase
MEESGRNRTPDKLSKSEKTPLFEACDRALRRTVDQYAPDCVIGVGAFAEKRAASALSKTDVVVGRIAHPSPANPQANRGWAAQVESALWKMGVPGF